jgi:hypothetical protein
LLAGAFIPELARQRNDRRRFEAKLRHEHHLQATLLGRGYLRYRAAAISDAATRGCPSG